MKPTMIGTRTEILRRVTTPWILGLALAATGTLAPATAPAHPQEEATQAGEDFEWRGTVARGKAIEIKGVNGGIHAEATTGREVEIVAKKRARRSDPASVQIEVIEHAGGVTVCAVYPTPRGERANQCEPGEGGRMNVKDNDVQVEFTVRVPAGVRFVGRTVNGGIEARRLEADAEAYTVNGSIEVSAVGVVRATTVNGSIDAEMGTSSREPLEFETVNGAITLVLPASTGAELRASTVNGEISSDLPLTVRGKINRRTVTGTIGRGGPELRMSTVNGSIRLRSAS